MVNTLLFGGTGLVGRHLIDKYAQSRNFIVMSRKEPIQSDCTWIECDLKNNLDFSKVGVVDEIIYLAQSPEYKNFPESAEQILKINALRFFELLEYARINGIKKVVYTSTGGIYGKGTYIFKEEDYLTSNESNWLGNQGGLSFYFKSKMLSEIVSQSYREFINITILRPFFIYGPGQQDTSLMMRLISSVQHDKPITLSGHNGITITPTHASDVATAIIHCIDSGLSDVYNIGGPEDLSLREVSENIGSVLGKKPIFSLDSKSSAFKVCANSSKLEKTGWTSKVSFKVGISSLLKSINV